MINFKAHRHLNRRVVVIGLLIASFVLCFPLASQRAITPPANQYNSYLSQDEEGFVWISSEDGVFRFDGNSFKHYELTAKGEPPVEQNHVLSEIIDDGLGKKWFTTYDALNQLDKRSGTVQQFRLTDENDEPLEDYLLLYHQAADRQLYVVVNQELRTFDLSSQAFNLPILSTIGKFFSVDVSKNGLLTTLIACPWSYGDGFEVHTHYLDNMSWQTAKVEVDFAGDSLGAIYRSVLIAPGKFVLAGQKGLYEYALEWQYPRKLLSSATCSFEHTNCTDIDYDPINRRLSFACGTSGVHTYSVATNNVLKCEGENSADSITIAHGSFYDREGGLWTTQYNKGLWYLKDEGCTDKSEDVGPGNSTLSTFTTTANGTVIVVDNKGGIHRKLFINDANWQKIAGLPAISNPMGSFVTQDAVWIYNRDNCLTFSNNDPTQFNNTSQQRIRKMESNDQGDRLILNQEGLRLEHADGNAYVIRSDRAQSNYPFHYGILLPDRTVALAHESTECWIGSITTDTFTVNHRHRIGVHINCVQRMVSGNGYWVGTQNGLYWIDDKDGSTGKKVLTELTDGSVFSVFSVYERNQRELVLGTSRGIITHHLADGHLTYYGRKEGLSTDLVDYPYITTGTDNSVFALVEGKLINWQPATQQCNLQLRPYIENLTVNDILAWEATNSFYEEELYLKYDNNTVGFKFGVIHFDHPEKVNISYRLYPLDTFWQTASPGASERYNNLSPGNYQLELQAATAFGYRSELNTFRINISPPFYSTWWFKLLVLLMGILIVGAVYLYLLRREIARQTRLRENQERIAAERDRIAGEVHDDLGGQISSILFLSEELMLANEVPQTRQIKRINELSKSSLQNIREIIFALDNRRNELVHLLRLVESNGTTFFGDKGIKFTFRNEIVDETIVLNSRQKRNLTLIIKEGFHNIFKHAAASWVGLIASEENYNLILTLTDDGKGFESEAVENAGGFGLENMRRKANAIGASIEIISTAGEGTTITIQWPLKNASQ